MDPKQAIVILDNATSQAALSRQGHQLVADALRCLDAFVKQHSEEVVDSPQPV